VVLVVEVIRLDLVLDLEVVRALAQEVVLDRALALVLILAQEAVLAQDLVRVLVLEADLEADLEVALVLVPAPAADLVVAQALVPAVDRALVPVREQALQRQAKVKNHTNRQLVHRNPVPTKTLQMDRQNPALELAHPNPLNLALLQPLHLALATRNPKILKRNLTINQKMTNQRLMTNQPRSRKMAKAVASSCNFSSFLYLSLLSLFFRSSPLILSLYLSYGAFSFHRSL